MGKMYNLRIQVVEKVRKGEKERRDMKGLEVKH